MQQSSQSTTGGRRVPMTPLQAILNKAGDGRKTDLKKLYYFLKKSFQIRANNK
jgi:hypothetical protein